MPRSRRGTWLCCWDCPHEALSQVAVSLAYVCACAIGDVDGEGFKGGEIWVLVILADDLDVPEALKTPSCPGMACTGHDFASKYRGYLCTVQRSARPDVLHCR